MSDSLTLLLLSDIHCSGARRFTFGRMIGESRTAAELRDPLTALLDSFKGKADFVFIAGDTTDHGLEQEYDGFLSIISGYDPAWFCIVPGNHDISNVNSPNLREITVPRFKSRMRALLPPGELDSDEYFPWVRDLGRGFAALGLDSTLERTAAGRIGPRQLERVRGFLQGDGFRNHHKIILLHHDVTGDADYFSGFEIPYGNGLADREEFLALLAEHARHHRGPGVTVIAGHTHHKRLDTHTVPGVNFVNTPSFGSRFEHDFSAIEIASDGRVRDLFPDAAPRRVRLFKTLGRFFVPRMKT